MQISYRIEEATELEAYSPPLQLHDDIYEYARDRTRWRAFKRLAACMVNNLTYHVTVREELHTPSDDAAIFGTFMVTIDYARKDQRP